MNFTLIDAYLLDCLTLPGRPAYSVNNRHFFLKKECYSLEGIFGSYPSKLYLSIKKISNIERRPSILQIKSLVFCLIKVAWNFDVLVLPFSLQMIGTRLVLVVKSSWYLLVLLDARRFLNDTASCDEHFNGGCQENRKRIRNYSFV